MKLSTVASILAYSRSVSLPMRGEWIEMIDCSSSHDWTIVLSLPMRGEWIEMRDGTLAVNLAAVIVSLPMRGEWIEIAGRL